MAWSARYYHPTENMPDYGREIGRINGEATLALMINSATQSEKEALLIGYVQLGIDYYYITKAGVNWPGEGGHSSGRKWPIIFAGIMLGDSAMQNVKALGRRFGEDDQTYYYNDATLPVAIRGIMGWTGAAALYDNVYWNGPAPKYEHVDPSQWTTLGNDGSGQNAGCHAEAYRRCCTSLAWVGQALSALMMNAKAAWGHDAFFDYCDRWMKEVDTDAIRTKLNSACGGVGTASGTVWDNFVKYMWAAYRNKLPSGVAEGAVGPQDMTWRGRAYADPARQTIYFLVPGSSQSQGNARLEIFDSHGDLVKCIRPKQGSSVLVWNAGQNTRRVEPGVYFYKATTGQSADYGKIIITY
jgi:hypothetical protein